MISKPSPSTQQGAVTATTGSPAWVVDVRRAIARLALLPEGWDRAGSPPVTPAALAAADLFLAELERYEEFPPPQVGPTVGGGLGIEWHHGSRELDVEFLPDGDIVYLKTEVVPDGLQVDSMEDGQLTIDGIEEVRRLADWLMTGV